MKYTDYKLDANDKQEIALQFLNDAREFLEMFELLIVKNKESPLRYQSSFISKATVNLVLAIECSLKSIISVSKIDDDNMEGNKLKDWLGKRPMGHNIPNLYTAAQIPIGEQTELASLNDNSLRLNVNDRYSIETLDEFIEMGSVNTLRWNEYYFQASTLLQIAEKNYAPYKTRRYANEAR